MDLEVTPDAHTRPRGVNRGVNRGSLRHVELWVPDLPRAEPPRLPRG